jgi:hypothetical protein
MNHPGVVILIVAVVVLAAAVAYYYSRQRRTRLLREHFGPEYVRVLNKERSVRRAEGVLEFREQARESLDIRPLSREDQVTFAEQWNEVQRHFVDDPSGTVVEADRLVNQVMAARGYPLANFEQRAELLSVDHPVVVQNYRAAHEIAQRQSQNKVTTEDLRKAMVHYGSLFNELLKDSAVERKNAAIENNAVIERKEAHG